LRTIALVRLVNGFLDESGTAKKLIDETSMAMSQVALASGFESMRRFNAGIR